ncbi:NlpC/P60 family protein [Rhodovulum euryhalinum]|uniref:NlpC/P60 family putative phage cell wall peptidase n=1 Tax=Rhodovulum euryhalinum TaxID=35805 RepID=A0A4R2KJY0_9RHOB|nr:NlpC/P60 family protein [Rhodovulum euryhalinum]TCO70906.1 NlpC/P60 family putative phage cell wall peptidase [Rhodovulum euryhalinum]
MSRIGERAAAEARRWIGTPYRHQGSMLGAGADCLGLLRGVWRTLYGAEPERVPPYTPDWSEPQGEETLWDAARRHLFEKPLEDEASGDVILFRLREAGVAKHLGIQGDAGPHATFIHAYHGHGVVESPLSTPWARRIVARFAFPERT